MKKYHGRKGLILALGLFMAVYQPAVSMVPVMEAMAYTERQASINGTNVNVRSGPGTTNSVVTRLSKGTSVTVIGEQNASDGALWYQIRFTGSGGAVSTGYVSGAYIKFPVSYTTDADFEAYLNAQGFPESYKNGLRMLHSEHPTWVFTAQHTGLDWNDVIANESIVGTNLVSTNSISSWKSTASGAYDWTTSTWPGFDGSSWVAASEDIIRYYMDPRNFLDDKYVFQFLTQSYDGSVHTIEGLQTMLKGTFMEGSTSSVGGSGSTSGDTGTSGGTSGGVSNGPGADLNGGTGNTGSDDEVRFESPSMALSRHETNMVTSSYGPGMDLGGGSQGSTGTSDTGTVQAPSSGSLSYAEIIMNAGQQTGVNPYVLAAMIIQENGKSGSASISGTRSPYEGYYNFYNIGAYATGALTITREEMDKGLAILEKVLRAAH